MPNFHKLPLIAFVTIMAVFTGCNKALVIKNVDYSQQIETVLTPDEHGIVHDIRHGISYSVLPFQYEETQDSSVVTVSSVRMIRNAEGYYFITAEGFKHVYVMEPKKGQLKLKKKILVNEKGLNSPAFNWRRPIVQLLDRSAKQVYLLNENGIYMEKTS